MLPTGSDREISSIEELVVWCTQILRVNNNTATFIPTSGGTPESLIQIASGADASNVQRTQYIVILEVDLNKIASSLPEWKKLKSIDTISKAIPSVYVASGLASVVQSFTATALGSYSYADNPQGQYLTPSRLNDGDTGKGIYALGVPFVDILIDFGKEKTITSFQYWIGFIYQSGATPESLPTSIAVYSGNAVIDANLLLNYNFPSGIYNETLSIPSNKLVSRQYLTLRVTGGKETLNEISFYGY